MCMSGHRSDSAAHGVDLPLTMHIASVPVTLLRWSEMLVILVLMKNLKTPNTVPEVLFDDDIS